MSHQKKSNWAEGSLESAFRTGGLIKDNQGLRQAVTRFDEGGHPRAPDGKFGAGSGGSSSQDADKATGKLKFAIASHKQAEKDHEAAQADHDTLAQNGAHKDTMAKARERLGDAKAHMDETGGKLKAAAEAHPDQGAANALLAKHGIVRTS